MHTVWMGRDPVVEIQTYVEPCWRCVPLLPVEGEGSSWLPCQSPVAGLARTPALWNSKVRPVNLSSK